MSRFYEKGFLVGENLFQKKYSSSMIINKWKEWFFTFNFPFSRFLLLRIPEKYFNSKNIHFVQYFLIPIFKGLLAPTEGWTLLFHTFYGIGVVKESIIARLYKKGFPTWYLRIASISIILDTKYKTSFFPRNELRYSRWPIQNVPRDITYY